MGTYEETPSTLVRFPGLTSLRRAAAAVGCVVTGGGDTGWRRGVTVTGTPEENKSAEIPG